MRTRIEADIDIQETDVQPEVTLALLADTIRVCAARTVSSLFTG